MTNQEAIKYLQQLYPNGGNCWLDEQRIEAIGMAIKALQEESVSEDLEKAAQQYSNNTNPTCLCSECLTITFKAGVNWQKEQTNKKREFISLKGIKEAWQSLLKVNPDITNSVAFIRGCEWQKKQISEKYLPSIQWTGNNLKEVINFTGFYKEEFEKWFHNSWEEYGEYMRKHDNIFKIFYTNGYHYECPVGTWIVKLPDGSNHPINAVLKKTIKLL